jgi:hypothetical protein
MHLPPTELLRSELESLYEQRNLVEDMIRTLQQYAVLLDEPLNEADTSLDYCGFGRSTPPRLLQ